MYSKAFWNSMKHEYWSITKSYKKSCIFAKGLHHRSSKGSKDATGLHFVNFSIQSTLRQGLKP